MKHILSFLITGLFGLLLLGCGQDTAVSTPTSIAQLPTAIATQTPQPNPTITSTLFPTVSPTKQVTPTKLPTNTPIPLNTATPIRTPTPDRYIFPSWVTDPTANVFFVAKQTERGSKFVVTLFNAQTAEYFDIPFNEGVSPSWVWQDGELYIRIYHPRSTSRVNQDAYQELIDLTTGEITTPPLNSLHGIVTESPDGRFLVNVLETVDSLPLLTLVNLESGKETELLDPFSGLFLDRIEAEWSPIANLVAVERVRYIEDEMARYGLRPESAFAVYDMDGTIINQLQDIGQRGFSWSSTEPIRLLFPAPYMLGSQAPCIFDIDSENYTCLSEISAWGDEEDVEFGLFQWSPDGNKVSFAYWDSIGGGLCYLELANSSITCPVTWDDLQIEEYLNRFSTGGGAYVFVTKYEWSPDSNFIALYINPAPPTGDDLTMQTVTVINIEEKVLSFVGRGFTQRYYPWRPSLQIP